MSDAQALLDGYVTALPRAGGLLWEGALFWNNPTPSGCARYQLRFTTKEGFDTPAAAIEAMAEAAPDYPKMAFDDPLAGLDAVPPSGTIVTVMRPKAPDGASGVETWRFGDQRPTPSKWTSEMVDALVARGFLREESSSGDDPNLSAIYDHYLVN